MTKPPQKVGRSDLMRSLHVATAPEAVAAGWQQNYSVQRGLYWMNVLAGNSYVIKANDHHNTAHTMLCGVMRVFAIIMIVAMLATAPVTWVMKGSDGIGLEYWVFQILVIGQLAALCVISMAKYNSLGLTLAFMAEIRSHKDAKKEAKQIVINLFLVGGFMLAIFIVVSVFTDSPTKSIPWLMYIELFSRIYCVILSNISFSNTSYLCRLQLSFFSSFVDEIKNSSSFTVADLMAGHLVLKRRLRNLSGLTQSILGLDALAIVILFPYIVVMLVIVGTPPPSFWVSVALLSSGAAGGDNMMLEAASFNKKMKEITRHANNLHARLTVWWKERGLSWNGTTRSPTPVRMEQSSGETESSIPMLVRYSTGSHGVMSAIWEADSDLLCGWDSKHKYCCDVPKPFSRDDDLSHLPPNEVRDFVKYTESGEASDCFQIHGIMFNSSVMRTLSSALYACIIIVVQPFIRNYISTK